MKYLFTLLIGFLFLACSHPQINCIRPYTGKEKALIKSLRTIGRVSIERMNYHYVGDSVQTCREFVTSTYTVDISEARYDDVKSLELMRSKTRSIAKNLYGNIIEDSIIYYMTDIRINITSKPRSKTEQFGNLYSAVFLKKDLARYCGFEIKYNEAEFFRSQLSKSDSLPIYKESIIE